MANDKSVMAVIRAARPSFRNKDDKVAFAVHASFVASGYELIATGRSAFAADALSSSSTEEVGLDNWNELENEYAFLYANPEKGSKKVLVKCLVINDTLGVDAVANGASQNVHCEINVDAHVEENGGSNYSTHYKNLKTLVNNVNTDVLSKLHESSTPSNPPRVGDQPANVRGGRDLPGPGTGRHQGGGNDFYPGDGDGMYPGGGGDLYPGAGTGMYPGGGGDLYPGAGTGMYPSRYPAIGGSDLYPGPGAGMLPSRGGAFEGGSMIVGPNDRRFGAVGGPGFPGYPGGLPGIRDPWPGVERPPGARFDPYGPPGLPDFDPDFARRRQGPGGRIHPDLEQPGRDSDYI